MTAFGRMRGGIVVLVTTLLVLSTVGAVVTVSAPVTAQTATTHVLGGTQSEGALKIYIDEGQLYTERWTGSSWQRQFYTDSGALLYVDGTTYSLGYYSGDQDATFQRQSLSGSTVTTVWTAGDVRIVQRVNYPFDTAQFYSLDWTITNEGTSSLSDVRFLRGEDTYLAGGDNGAGFWDAGSNTVGVTKTVSGTQQRLSFQGVTDPVGYESRYYGDVRSSVNSGSLSNVVDPNENTDNGYALEWRRATLGAGSNWEISAYESFVNSALVVTSPGTVYLPNGSNSVNVTFDVQNVGDSSEDVSYAVDCPTGWTCSLPSLSETIPAGGSSQVTVTATPPSGVTSGVYSVTLTATGSGTGSQAIAQVEVGDDRPKKRAAPENLDPIAHPGFAQTVRPGDSVVLDGTRSEDPDGTIVEYQWLSHHFNDNVMLTNDDEPVAGFVAPDVRGRTSLYLILRVTDDNGSTDEGLVYVHVQPRRNAGGNGGDGDADAPGETPGGDPVPAIPCEELPQEWKDTDGDGFVDVSQRQWECRYPSLSWIDWGTMFGLD